MGDNRPPVMPLCEAPPVRGSSHFESVDLGSVLARVGLERQRRDNGAAGM